MLSPSFRFSAVAVACTLLCLAAPAVHAQQAGATLPTVTVTGEKTERPLEQTAPSVRVFTTSEIAEQPNVSSANDLLEQSANITSSGTHNLAPAVRGVDGTGPAQGADAFLAGTRPRLNFQVDGRTAPYNEVIFGDLGLWDVERVEVFRGAQSTLQGRNALAGTVIYKTNDPTFEREVGVRAVVGNQQQRQLSAVVSGPIIDDELAFRLAVDGSRRQSFVTGFQNYPGISDPGEFEAGTARGKLLWKPKALPGFSTLLTLSHTDFRGPQTESVRRPFNDLVTSYVPMNVFRPRNDAAVLDTTYEMDGGWTFENRLVAADSRTTRYGMPGDGNAVIASRDYTLEPRLRFRSLGGWAGFVGLYAFSAKQHDTIDLFGGGEWNDRTTTTSIYGEATRAVLPDLDLTLGGRYEQEHRRRQGTLAFFTTDFDETYRTFLPKATLAWRQDPATTWGVSVARGYNGGGAAFTYAAPFTNYTFEPEYVWTTELFGRKRLLDGSLLLSGNVFYSRYKDMQLPFDLNPDPAVWSYVVRNAPRAVTYGAEVSAAWQATRELRLTGELGLLRAKVTDYGGSGVEGNELPRSPKLTAVLGAAWRHATGFELGGTARYSGAYFSEITNVSRARVEPGWITNLRASYPVGQARVFAFVNNVFDSRKPVQLDADPNGTSATDTAILPRPRTMGIGVEAWF